MKLHGQCIPKPPVEVLVIPRGDTQVIIKAESVDNFDQFMSLCPRPEPPLIKRKNEPERPHFEDETYQKKLTEWAELKGLYSIWKALEATDGLEWDKLDKDDPSTWKHLRDDLLTSFSEPEAFRILELTSIANGLNQTKIDEATKSFLAGQVELKSSTSQNIEQNIT